MRTVFPQLRPRLLRAWRAPMVVLALLFGALAMPSAAASPASSAPTFGSMDAAGAVIAPLAYGGVVPATITFDGSASYCVEFCTLTSYEWDFGDGGTGTGAIASHTYTTSGYFTVTLTVRSNNGLSATASTIANVFQYTIGKFTQSTSVGLMPLSVAFDASGSLSNWDRPIVTYAWNFGDGTTGSGRTITHVFTTPGVRQVTLTVTDRLGGYQIVGGYVFVQDPLLASTNLTATSPAKGVTSLTWTNRTVMISTLVIERCTGSRCTNFVPVSSVPGTFTSFSESGLRSSTVFRYRIRATDYLGNTAVSSIVSVKTR